jgi:hypothetical protein
MPVDQAVFLRIDTTNGCPYLEGPSGELVVSTLLAANDKGYFDLLGFVVLPNELQVLMVSHGKPVTELLGNLEASVHTRLTDVTTIFDTDIYKEKVDSEEIRVRLKWMHQAPVRSRLATLSEAYPYSSANSRFRSLLKLEQIVM